jgi:AcrR family transcriptional regulator
MEAADSVDDDKARVLDPAVPADVPVGLRERKKLETFRALQSAARRLVGERGFANVTIEDISAAANVSKRTFFNYFESKEAAIVDPELGKVELLAAELAARPASETPLEALWAATLVVLARHAAGLEDLSGLIAANPTLAARQVTSFGRYRQVIVEWAAARTGCDPDTDVYPELLAAVAGLMNQLSLTRWQPGSGEEGHTRVADETFALLARGLAAPRS